MKKFFSLAVVLSVCLSLVSCSGNGRASAESVVEDAIKAFQSADKDATRSYWGETDFTETSSDLTAEDEIYSQQLLEKIAGGLTYIIKGSSENAESGTATVTVEFTNMDMVAVMGEFIGEAFSAALGYAFLPEDQQPSEEELNEMYMDSLNAAIENNKDNTVTNTVEVSLSLDENAWKINPADDVIDAMVGGMMSYADSMEKTSDGEDADGSTIETTRVNPATLGEYVVEIKSAVVTQDYDGNPAVVITYSWTNNSAETVTPMSAVTASVFQNGVGMESTYVSDESIYNSDLYWTEVRPGTTIDVQEAFILNDTTAPIEVEVAESFAWGAPVEIAYMEFEVAQ